MNWLLQLKIQLMAMAVELTKISLAPGASESAIMTQMERWYQALATVDVPDSSVFVSPSVPSNLSATQTPATSPSGGAPATPAAAAVKLFGTAAQAAIPPVTQQLAQLLTQMATQATQATSASAAPTTGTQQASAAAGS